MEKRKEVREERCQEKVVAEKNRNSKTREKHETFGTKLTNLEGRIAFTRRARMRKGGVSLSSAGLWNSRWKLLVMRAGQGRAQARTILWRKTGPTYDGEGIASPRRRVSERDLAT